MRYTKKLMVVSLSVLLFLSSCSSFSLFRGGSVDKGTETTKKEDEETNSKIRLFLKEFSSVAEKISASSVRSDIYSPPLEVLREETLRDVLQKKHKVRFDPASLGAVTFREKMVFQTSGDFFDYIRQEFGVYVEKSPSGIVVSNLREIKYDIAFLEKYIEQDLSNLLNHPESKAYLSEKAGSLTVYDNDTGQKAVALYIENLRRTYLREFSYSLSFFDGTTPVFSSAGIITFCCPVSTKVGVLSVAPKKGEYVEFHFEPKGGPSTGKEGIPSFSVPMRSSGQQAVTEGVYTIKLEVKEIKK